MKRFFFGKGEEKPRRRLVWEPKKYRETNKYLANAGRGFYNINGIVISDAGAVEDWVFDRIMAGEETETLELLQIHIGAYRDREISPFGLGQIEKIFDAYARSARPLDLIVRVLYDWDGRGYESDPASMAVIFRHMEQMGAIFSAYRDRIFIVQGVFVGSWGEMHSSRYLTADSFQKLIRKMQQVVPKTAYLAVRTPAFWRMAAGRAEPLARSEAEDADGLPARLSLFNDGITGNETDCGTYGSCSCQETGNPGEPWIREEELSFQERLNLFVPNGGEVVIENRENDLENACRVFARMRLTYLNKGYDLAVLDKWRRAVVRSDDPVWRGMSGLDYIERHLGYRFVIRSASLKETGWRREDSALTVEIENVGYAPRYRPCKVEILCVPLDEGGARVDEYRAGGERSLPVDADVRNWLPGERIALWVPIPVSLCRNCEIYLRVTEENGSAVLFANESIAMEDGRCFLGIARERK